MRYKNLPAGNTMPKKDYIAVIIIKDGVVDEAKLFTDNNKAEECFTLECLNRLADKEDIEDLLDDGYYEGNNFSVCITHPEILF
jgi:hypothetical protein